MKTTFMETVSTGVLDKDKEHYLRSKDMMPFDGPDNGLSSSRKGAIFWTNNGILLIGSIGTNLSETWIGVHTF